MDQVRPYHAGNRTQGQEAAAAVLAVMRHAAERDEEQQKKKAPKKQANWMLPVAINLGVFAVLKPALLARRFATEQRRGFTLIELLIVTVIIGSLASMAAPNFARVIERARMVQAIGDIKAMQQSITEFEITEGRFPTSLLEVGFDGKVDPWKNPYVYLLHDPPPKKTQGARKDRFLTPVNSDYDLYSMGIDGDSKAAFTAKASRDDVVRANDGGFVGLAEDF